MTNEANKARRNRPSRYRHDKVEVIADAVIESDRMDYIARYLAAGRRFANLETEEIKRRWTEAVRIFLASYGSVNPREMMISIRSFVLERCRRLRKMSGTRSRQVRDGSSMMMAPRFAHEYGTASVAFGMTSKSDEIEGSRGPQDRRS
jgi:hypothetical protein